MAPAQPSAGGTPDAMPFDIPYGVSIGLERAKQVMAAAEAVHPADIVYAVHGN